MSALDRHTLRALAVSVFAALEDEPPAAARLLARALSIADEPLSRFALAFEYWADALETPGSDGGLAVVAMAYDLRHVAYFHPEAPALIDRLEHADGVLWERLAGALRDIWTAHQEQVLELDRKAGEDG